jgi:hypothetical protein
MNQKICMGLFFSMRDQYEMAKPERGARKMARRWGVLSPQDMAVTHSTRRNWACSGKGMGAGMGVLL